METRRRYVLTPVMEHTLPVFLESIGYNPEQEPITRKHGYPLYHWFQTISGEGSIEFEGKCISIPPYSGVILMPGVPHSYKSKTDRWGTLYVTFGGAASENILSALQLQESTLLTWEANSPIADCVSCMLRDVETMEDLFGLDASVNVYRFLAMLRKYSRTNKKEAFSRNLERLRPLLMWFEQHIDNPDIGSKEMGSVLGLSYSRINVMFRDTFMISPYAYLINLRLRKAKDLLVSTRCQTVISISAQVGFRDVSHFIATFHKANGMTPEQFRNLH